MKTVMVTGANRGLGLEFCRQYAGDGWAVIGACRTPEQAHALHNLAGHHADTVRIVPLDVTSGKSVREAASRLHDASIDVLINDAGISGVPGQTTGRVDYDNWHRVLDVNTMGPMRVLESFLEPLERSDRKLVVTITSGMGSLADNTSGGSIAYRTSKTAVNMAMRSAAIDLKPRGIVCVLIHPGWVRTDMGGPHAMLSAEESVRAMRELICRIKPKDSGKFFNRDGQLYPW